MFHEGKHVVFVLFQIQMQSVSARRSSPWAGTAMRRESQVSLLPLTA